ncbi:hypothetical protein RJ43_19290 [Alteromonas macleodii]|uniref:hypothetical protein n=1 Tax=Alteromonas macleodii TaxID=28108 RepID=UPI00057E9AF3|nr:hypothetical protein [Alteromonas macleodii]KHT48366.1 hypothetical protein RJ43_19290 [Alteromonas macleodii]
MEDYRIINKDKHSSGKVWVIRSGTDADFYDHFRQNNVIAIDHAEILNTESLNSGQLNNQDCEKLLISLGEALGKRFKGKKYKGSNASKVGQVRRFLVEVSVGDTIMTLSPNNFVLTGIVKSSPYISRIPITLSKDKGNNKQCEFFLRRDIEWGRSRSKDSLPYIVDKSLRNTSTIFGIKKPDAVKALNHWLYPFHFIDNEVRCSLDLKTKERISNRDLSNISQKLDDLEAASRFIAEKIKENATGLKLSDFEDELLSFIKDFDQYDLKTQQAFMSPGHQFVQLKAERLQQVIFAAIFALTFSDTCLATDDLSDEEKMAVQLSSELVRVLEEERDSSVAKHRMGLAIPKQIGLEEKKSQSPKKSFPTIKSKGVRGK